MTLHKQLYYNFSNRLRINYTRIKKTKIENEPVPESSTDIGPLQNRIVDCSAVSRRLSIPTVATRMSTAPRLAVDKFFLNYQFPIRLKCYDATNTIIQRCK